MNLFSFCVPGKLEEGGHIAKSGLMGLKTSPVKSSLKTKCRKRPVSQARNA